MSKPKKSKRFNYQLESVLKVRNIREKQEQEKFMLAERKFLEEQKKEEEIKTFQDQKYKELRQEMSSGDINFQHVLMRKSHLEILKEDVKKQEEQREEAEKKKDEKREDLIKAAKNKKIIQKDKENKRGACLLVSKTVLYSSCQPDDQRPFSEVLRLKALIPKSDPKILF